MSQQIFAMITLLIVNMLAEVSGAELGKCMGKRVDQALRAYNPQLFRMSQASFSRPDSEIFPQVGLGK